MGEMMKFVNEVKNFKLRQLEEMLAIEASARDGETFDSVCEALAYELSELLTQEERLYVSAAKASRRDFIQVN